MNRQECSLLAPAIILHQQFKNSAYAALLSCLVCSYAFADKYASIIIDDLGYSYEHGHDIVELPGALTLAILPGTLYAKDIARLAQKNHKEVMLHLPLQSVENQKPSPGTLDLHMTKNEFLRQLRLNLNSVPYVRGVNNHMGSLLTRHPGHMNWLMSELARRGDLYFVDSKTTLKSIAEQVATEHNLPNMTRDFFLDPDFQESTIQKQFARFIKAVQQRGYALAIAHPHPSTIKFLRSNLSQLKEQGINLIPVSKLIHNTQTNSHQLADNLSRMSP